MDVLRYKSLRRVVLRVTSPEMLCLDVHWLGRSLLCPGRAVRGCPACKVSSPRTMYYAHGRMKNGSQVSPDGLIELTGDIVSQLFRSQFDIINPCGWSFALERREDRPGWLVTQAAQSPEDHPDRTPILRSLEVLYGLQRLIDVDLGITEADALNEWLKLQSDRILARISMSCRNGSHSFA